MSELVDAEAMVISFLTPLADPVKVATTMPGTIPDRFVRAWRNGGAADNRIIDNPIITVDVYAESTSACSALASTLRNALLSEYSSMPLVRAVTEISGPASTPDSAAERERYRFTVQLRVRAKRA